MASGHSWRVAWAWTVATWAKWHPMPIRMLSAWRTIPFRWWGGAWVMGPAMRWAIIRVCHHLILRILNRVRGREATSAHISPRHQTSRGRRPTEIPRKPSSVMDSSTKVLGRAPWKTFKTSSRVKLCKTSCQWCKWRASREACRIKKIYNRDRPFRTSSILRIPTPTSLSNSSNTSHPNLVVIPTSSSINPWVVCSKTSGREFRPCPSRLC